jgi:hypothetical protein
LDRSWERTSGPVHSWFELSYSSYLVLPRVLMQSMPLQWQRRMVACLEELDEEFRHVERASGYQVLAGEWCYPGEMSEQELRAASVERVERDEDGVELDPPVYYDAAGNELDPHTSCAFVPGREPLPRYRHGYVAPASDSTGPTEEQVSG